MVKFLVIFVVGTLVGIFNGAAGGASVISFPALVAVGLAPVSAVVTSAVGVYPANVFALISKASQVKALLKEHYKVLIACSIGAVIGAVALTNLPQSNFKRLTPFLLLLASLSLLIKISPAITALERRIEIGLMFVIGVYCGYFGPGQGVMVIAVLARDAGRSVTSVNTSKNLIVAISNTFSIIIFIFGGLVDWKFTSALLVSSSLGGYLGGRLVKRFSRNFYRTIILTVGVISSLWFFYLYWLK